MSDATATMTTPTSIGRYVVERVLGAGGMGRVYACKDPSLDRSVAVKVLLDDLAKDAEMSARFRREAQAMAKLQSPYVITVFEVGDADGLPFIAMELLDGEDIGGLLEAQGALPPERALRFTLDAARGLQAAERAGLVHRDVKPANLFLAGAQCKLADFGLARPVDGSANLTSAGIVVGSPHYLAPEVARGADATIQSDMYALGATLFEMLTGKPPYKGETPLEVISAHLTEDVPALPVGSPGAAADGVLQQLMAKKPAERFASYDALVSALEQVLATTTSTSTSTSTSPSDAPPAGEPADTSATAVLPVASSTTSKVQHSGTALAAPPTTGAAKARGKVKTENLTIMFTDIAGYTSATSSQSREQAAAWLELHDALLRPVVKAFSGKVVKTIGDALLVTFKSPTDGVLCGTAIQDRLFDHNQTCSDDEKLHVRVALSTGEVRLQGGDIFGEPVNIAARLEGLAEPGEVLFSDATFATMNTAEVNVDARGSRPLKGIARDVTLYAALPTGHDGQPPFQNHALSRVDFTEGLLSQAGRGVADVASNLAALGSTSNASPGKGNKAALLVVGGVGALTALAVVLFVLGNVFSAITTPADIALVDDGKADEVIRRLSPKKSLTPDEALALGHAYVAEGKDGKAADAFHDAFVDGATSTRALDELTALLRGKAQEDAAEALARYPNDDVDDRLVSLATSDDWGERHGALSALRTRKKADLIDQEAFGIRDLVDGETCGRRHFGLKMLKRKGKTQDAVDAIREAGKRLPDNLCLMLDVNAAERAVQKRMSD